MEKLVDTQYPIHDLLRRRWSPRAFSDREVELESLRSMLEAARWAPSCFNEQPWSFLVATKANPEEFDRMLGCLMEGNQVWAKHAPVLMISVATHNFQRNGNPNRHAFHDVGLAAGSLVMQATALGLFVHQMGGFSVEKAREVYGIPEGSEPVAAFAVGYLGQADLLPEDMRGREQSPSRRKSMAEFVFAGQWGQTPSWVQG